MAMFRFQDFYFEESDKGEEEHILNWYTTANAPKDVPK